MQQCRQICFAHIALGLAGGMNSSHDFSSCGHTLIPFTNLFIFAAIRSFSNTRMVFAG